MRVFWSIVALLAIAVAALLGRSALRSSPSEPSDTRGATAHPAPELTTPHKPTVETPAIPAPLPPNPAEQPRVPAPADATPVPIPVPTPTAPPLVASGPAPAAAADPAPAPLTGAPDIPALEARPADPIPTPASVTTAPDPDTLADDLAAALASPTTLPGAASSKPSEDAASAITGPPAPAPPLAPLKLEPQDDGSTLVDGRFVMRGKGTKADPYIVTWEQLISAQESYQPRRGQKVIPDRLKLLDGKWVKMSGYVAFPIMAQEADEMLVMLNQWDGCCIGVPPTPYDAIEVKLARPAEGDDRLLFTGAVTGILKVDPYLVKDWLVSLYLMENATVTK